MNTIYQELKELKNGGNAPNKIGKLYNLTTEIVRKILSLECDRDKVAVDLHFRGNYEGTSPGLPGLSTRDKDDRPNWHKKVYGSG